MFNVSNTVLFVPFENGYRAIQTCNFFPTEKQEGQSYQQPWELIKPRPSLPLNIVNT